MPSSTHILENFHRAIDSLADAIARDDGSDLHRDAIIQRFEYCTELSRKTLQKIYTMKQFDERLFPKEIIKKAEEFGIVSSTASLVDAINERNILSHNYSEEQAIDSYEFITSMYKDFFSFYDQLVSYLNENNNS